MEPAHVIQYSPCTEAQVQNLAQGHVQDDSRSSTGALLQDDIIVLPSRTRLTTIVQIWQNHNFLSLVVDNSDKVTELRLLWEQGCWFLLLIVSIWWNTNYLGHYKHLSGAAHLTIEVCLNMEYLDPMEGHLGYVGYLSLLLLSVTLWGGEPTWNRKLCLKTIISKIMLLLW